MRVGCKVIAKSIWIIIEQDALHKLEKQEWPFAKVSGFVHSVVSYPCATGAALGLQPSAPSHLELSNDVLGVLWGLQIA